MDHSPEQSAEQTPLDALAERVRNTVGVQGETILEGMDDAKRNVEALSEEDFEKRIQEIEQGMDTLTYESATERSMYYALLERLRLRHQITKGAFDRTPESQDMKDLEVLKDLDTRITYAMYEEATVDQLFDTVTRYEAYRKRFQLDRPAKEGGVPRNEALEEKLRAQIVAIEKILPQMTLIKKIQHFEKNKETWKTPDLYAKIPADKRGDLTAYFGELSEALRRSIGEAAPSQGKEEAPTTIGSALMVDLLGRHFDSVLAHRKELLGTIGPDAEAKKNALQEEHRALIEEALMYANESLVTRASIARLLVGSGIDRPEQAEPQTAPDNDYGLLENRDALAPERDKQLDALDGYTAHFRAKVLRGDKQYDVPLLGETRLDPSLLLEDVLTQHVLPLKMKLMEPLAEGATYPWKIQDYLFQTIGFDTHIQESRREAVMEPLYKRLGIILPENYLDLPPDEQQKVRIDALKNSTVAQGKLQSMREAMNTFQAEQGKVLDAIESDTTLLRALLAHKKPEDLILSGEPVSPNSFPPDIASLKTDEEIAGAYRAILAHMTDMHAPALVTAQTNFMHEVNVNLDLHINVADIEMQLGTAWIREWAYAFGVLLGEGAVAAYILRHPIKVSRGVIRAGKALGRGGLRAGKIATEGGVQGGKRVINAARTGSLRTTLGHLGFLGAELGILQELVGSIEENATMKELPEAQTIEAALDLWRQNKPKKPLAALEVTQEDIDYAAERLVLEQLSRLLPMEQALQVSLPQVSELQAIQSVKEHWDTLDPEIAERLQFLERERHYVYLKGKELQLRREKMLQEVSVLHSERAKEFPVFDANKPLDQQVFVKDKDGNMRVNTSTASIGFVPLPWGGPLKDLVRHGKAEREKMKFSPQQETQRFDAIQKEYDTYTQDARAYMERFAEHALDIEAANAVLAKQQQMSVDELLHAQPPRDDERVPEGYDPTEFTDAPEETMSPEEIELLKQFMEHANAEETSR